MVLILSSEVHELSTEDVMDWLYYKNCPYKRVNGEFITENAYDLEISNSEKSTLFDIDDYSDVNVVWFRRWHKRETIESINISIEGDALVNLRKHLNNEVGILSAYYYSQFSNATWVDHPKYIHLNKLRVLSLAVREGLTIPATMVATTKPQIENFFKKYKRLITKPISEVSYFNTHNESFGMDTKEIDWPFIQSLDTETFFPSLIQELIEKEFDIRIFYIDKAFYSMAILSQRREESVIDFRNYDYKNPDRRVPFKLPKEVELKLEKLVKKLNLEHCSIDMIRSITGEYVFLEINPVGQFGMVSKPCNYHLEMKVAYFLEQKSNDNLAGNKF